MLGSNGDYEKWIAMGKGVSAFFGAFSGVMTVAAVVLEEGVFAIIAVSGMVFTGCAVGGTCGLWCARRRERQPLTVVHSPLYARHVRVLQVTHGAQHNHGAAALTRA